MSDAAATSDGVLARRAPPSKRGSAGLLAQVIDDHGVAGPLDVGGHAAAHVAQADESYGFHNAHLLR